MKIGFKNRYVAWVVAFLFLWGNLHRALVRTGPEILQDQSSPLRRFVLRWSPCLLGATAATPFMLYFADKWDLVLRRIWHQPIGRSDPVFNRDLSFYLFDLPFLEVLQNSLTALAFLTLALTLALVLLHGFIRSGGQGFVWPGKPMGRHLGLLFVLYLAGYCLGLFSRPLRTSLFHERSGLRSRL